MSVPTHTVSSAPVISGVLQAEPLDADRLRTVIGWADELLHLEPTSVVADLVAAEPPSCGDRRWDAMVAGLVEHLAFVRGFPAPAWVRDPARFLESFWFPVDLPSVRAMAFRDAPASLARRGVFLDRRDLSRV